MSWSYTGDPTSTDMDAVRFHVGDTDSAWELLQDEEILYVLAQQTSAEPRPLKEIYKTAAICADAVATFFARQADKSDLSLSVSASQRSEAFKACAQRLWSKAGITVSEDGRQAVLTSMFAGGLTISGKRDLARDRDAVQPAFSRGQDDHPGTLQDTSILDIIGEQE